jgi:hypothetical protein
VACTAKRLPCPRLQGDLWADLHRHTLTTPPCQWQFIPIAADPVGYLYEILRCRRSVILIALSCAAQFHIHHALSLHQPQVGDRKRGGPSSPRPKASHLHFHLHFFYTTLRSFVKPSLYTQAHHDTINHRIRHDKRQARRRRRSHDGEPNGRKQKRQIDTMVLQYHSRVSDSLSLNFRATSVPRNE